MAVQIVLAVLLGAQVHAPTPTLDPCALLADADVQRVLGVHVKETSPSTEDARGLLVHQCYLDTGTPRSISIAVAGNTTARGQTVKPRQFWQQQFHGGRHEAAGAEEGRGEASSGGRPRAIRGIGDEAFWSGTRVAGALYVLQGDTFIRVSVGGMQNEADRMTKSRELAAAVLRRLPRR